MPPRRHSPLLVALTAVFVATWASAQAAPLPDSPPPQVAAQGTAPAEDSPAQLAALRAEATSYENGEGVSKDMQRAYQLYCRAAKKGDAEAQYDIGWMYFNGCLLYTSPSPRDRQKSRMPSSA